MKSEEIERFVAEGDEAYSAGGRLRIRDAEWFVRKVEAGIRLGGPYRIKGKRTLPFLQNALR